jgi:hypothetical protein
MPIIDPKVEEPARQMLGHAIRSELAELAAAIRAGGGERYRQANSQSCSRDPAGQQPATGAWRQHVGAPIHPHQP